MNNIAPPSKLEQELRDMNEALLVSSIRQHELIEQAQNAEAALRESEERLARELAATRQLQSASALLIEGGDMHAVHQRIVDAAADIMRSDFASMQMLCPERGAPGSGGELRLLAFRGFNPQAAKFWKWVRPTTASSCGRALSTGQRCVVGDIETCAWMANGDHLATYRDTGIRSVQSTPLFSRDGRLLGVISTHWRTPHTPTDSDLRPFDILAREAADLIERKQAEDALRQSEEQYRTLVEHVTDYAIFRMDPEGRATTWNEGVERVLGFEESAFVGNNVVPLIFTPEDVEQGVAQKELDDAAAYGTAGDDRWMRRKDGSRFFATGVLTALRDETGQLIGFTKVMRDQTERKRIETALHESEVRYRGLFETGRDGTLILDAATGRIIDANPFMSEFLGYSHNALIGKELWEIGLFSDKSASVAAVHELQEKGFIRYEHLPLETNQGRRVEVEVVANAYREGCQGFLQCNIRDITERVRLENQAREQAAALSDLHRRKDEFLAMLSHELRNPIAPIANAVQLLRIQHGHENPIQQQARGIIERQVGQLKRLVDDLLEVARITTGRVQLRPDNIALAGIVERAVETARPLIQQRRHELRVSLPPQPVWLYADAARLEQVVVNLLTNAAKYTDEGGRISLTVQQDDDAAVLRVRDTGIGIAPELLPRIFDLFTQAERSLDRSQGGLGIGLCLVQRLVELHGGTVEAHSVLGKGSEFVVRLPLLRTSAPAPPSPFTESTPPTVSLRALVVDDNVDTAESMALLLKASGHDVRTAHNGPAALEAALAHRPDVVLLDIGLPGLDGFEVAKRLRQQPMFKDVVLVAMTGYGQETDRQRSQESGFDHHLVKPADFHKLQQILAAVAENAK